MPFATPEGGGPITHPGSASIASMPPHTYVRQNSEGNANFDPISCQNVPQRLIGYSCMFLLHNRYNLPETALTLFRIID